LRESGIFPIFPLYAQIQTEVAMEIESVLASSSEGVCEGEIEKWTWWTCLGLGYDQAMMDCFMLLKCEILNNEL